MLEVSGVCFSYGKDDGENALNNITFEALPGSILAIMGANGSGKSTLLKTIDGILKPKRGTVFIDGAPAPGMNRNELAKKIGYMPQKFPDTHCTVFDAVMLGRKPHIRWEASRDDIAAVKRILNMLGMEKFAFRYTTELSGGELQKVVIGRALCQEPSILLLDEPINHLDIKNQLEIMDFLRKITREMRLVTIIVLHDLNIAIRFADFFGLMKDGNIHAIGGIDVINPENMQDVYGIKAEIHNIKGIPMLLPVGA